MTLEDKLNIILENLTPEYCNNKDIIYTFVKVKNTDFPKLEYKDWYLIIENEQDLLMWIWNRFKPITQSAVKSALEFKQIGHQTSMYSEQIQRFADMNGVSWCGQAILLEKQTLLSRLSFLMSKGTILQNHDLTWMPKKGFDIIDMRSSQSPDFPEPSRLSLNDIKISQWQGGKHFYSKVGKIDVVDKNGDVKWNTYQKAMEVSQEFVRQYNSKNR